MSEEDHFFTFGQHSLYYRTLGQGPQPMLLLHGYGQDHQVFHQIAAALGSRYKLYCFDLFYHGRSSCPSIDKPITAYDWRGMIRSFLDVHRIGRVSLLGYSMGGRLVLSLLNGLSERVSEVVLIAPDGIRSNRWYQLGSTTYLGQVLLRRMITRPKILFTLINTARRYGLVHPSVLKFVENHMRTRKDRYQVYRTWVGLQGIQPNLSQVIRQCNQQSISTKIYVGQYDQIVKAKAVVSFHKKLDNSHLYFLPGGHNALIHQATKHLSTRY